MRIFQCSEEKKLIVVIGLGLIGTEIAYLVANNRNYHIIDYSINWNDPFFFKNQFTVLLE
jgi:3-hydroxyacyl-CoA dehydrogenase